MGAPLDRSWGKLREELEEATSGDFEILQELGRGGMGAVYLAREHALERLVAIKVLLPHLLLQPTILERFRNEARLVAALRHPAIVNIHGVRQHHDLHFFVMDYIEGATVQQLIRAFGTLPVSAVRSVLYQVGGALAYAHRQGKGVVHRDIKPSNIMLDADGSATVMDFGISKVMTTSSGLTQTGMVVGTPEYMSPEQCRGDPLTAASDQYSLGLVAYAMLTGSPPFAGPHYTVLHAHTTQDPPDLSELRPDCPESLAEAVMRMLAKGPKDRWPDIRSAVRQAGARSVELGDPVRDEMGALVREVVGDTAAYTPVAELSVTPPGPGELYPGDEVVLEAMPMDRLGQELHQRDLQWSSSDPNVATVGDDGSVVLLREGIARIVAECEGHRREVALTVARPSVSAVELDLPSRPLHPGDSVELSATPLDARGRPLPERPVKWSSSAPSVARLEGRVLHAVQAGAARIEAWCEGHGESVQIRVLPRPVSSLDLSEPPADVVPEDRFVLRVVPRDDRGNPVEGRTVQWTSSDPKIARITNSGRVDVLAPGRVDLRATCDGVEASVGVEVFEEEPTHRVPILVGSPKNSPEPVPAPGAPVPPNRKKEPAESGSNGRMVLLGIAAVVALVGVSYGVVGPGPGDSPRENSAPSIEITTPPPVLEVGDRMELAARVVGTVADDVDPEIRWRLQSTGDSLIIGLEGRMISARAPGLATVLADARGISPESVDVRVQPPAVASVRVAPPEGRLEIGRELRLTATPFDQAGNPVTADRVQWSLDESAPGVASLSDEGILRALSPGTVVVQASIRGRTVEGDFQIVAPQQAAETDDRPASAEPTLESAAAAPEPEPPPAPGRITIRVLPWANVLVNGEVVAEEVSRFELSLPPGTHRIRLENRNMIPFDTVIAVAPGAAGTIEKQLRSGNQ